MNNHLYRIQVCTFSILLLVASCTVAPVVIDYGSDLCNYCKMTIVDTRHAAQMVSSKGKPYLYDAIECMIADYQRNKDVEFRLLMVSDYSKEKSLINAYASTYLISEGIPSPMGAYLSAFESETHATQAMLEKGGEMYTFEQVVQLIGKK